LEIAIFKKVLSLHFNYKQTNKLKNCPFSKSKLSLTFLLCLVKTFQKYITITINGRKMLNNLFLFLLVVAVVAVE